MRKVERTQQLFHEAHGALEAQRPPWVQLLPQVAAAHQLHDHERQSLIVASVVHANDVGVLEATSRLRLAAKARLKLRCHVLRQLVDANRLDGHAPIDVRIVSFIDKTHRALAQRSDDLVATELFQRHGGRLKR